MQQLFCMADVSQGDSFAQWRNAICDHFVPLRPEPIPGSVCSFGELRTCLIDTLTLTSIHVSGQRIIHGPSEIARNERDVFFLTLQCGGRTQVEYDNQQRLIEPGHFYLLDCRQPFVLTVDDARTIAMTIPRHTLDCRFASLDQRHGAVLQAGSQVWALLRSYICGIAETPDGLQGPEQTDVAEHLLCLIRHGLARGSQASEPREAARNRLLTRAYRLIERDLGDPDFDPKKLARECGTSLRSLQLLFATRGSSPMRAIMQRRTNRAKRMLLDPARAASSIAQVAFECGFRDLSHFGRLFLSETGMTPRAWRRNAAGAN